MIPDVSPIRHSALAEPVISHLGDGVLYRFVIMPFPLRFMNDGDEEVGSNKQIYNIGINGLASTNRVLKNSATCRFEGIVE